MLVYAEQGIGDEIMFASCLADLFALGARVTLECSSRLASLFSRSFPDADVHGMAKAAAPAWAGSLQNVSWQVAIGDLPRFFRRNLDQFPGIPGGYLRADPELVGEYRRRVHDVAMGRPVIALAWRGGDWRSGRAKRSLALPDLARLVSDLPALWISLQHGEVDEEIGRLRANGVDVLHWPEVVADLDRMAGLLNAVDEVVSVDNTVAHLSGALGLPARILLSAAPEWRYGLRGEGMAWYPRVRLYRQGRLGDWSDVIDRMRKHVSSGASGMPRSDRT